MRRVLLVVINGVPGSPKPVIRLVKPEGRTCELDSPPAAASFHRRRRGSFSLAGWARGTVLDNHECRNNQKVRSYSIRNRTSSSVITQLHL